jgi:hypothetical protein
MRRTTVALRHYQGTIQEKPAAWTCPSCGRSNTTPLEQGCACGVGRDAKVATAGPVAVAVVGELEPFAQWWNEHIPLIGKLGTAREIAAHAWEAGAAWALAPRPDQPTKADPATGGWGLHMSTPAGYDDGPLEARAHATILAALAFYRDATLAYGTIAGQLNAAEVGELIAKLQPAEEVEG